jgi:hypothetical protein
MTIKFFINSQQSPLQKFAHSYYLMPGKGVGGVPSNSSHYCARQPLKNTALTIYNSTVWSNPS